MTLRLKQKIVGLALLAAILPLVGILINTAYQKKQTEKVVVSESDILVRENLEQVAFDLYGACVATNDLLINSLEHYLNFANEHIKSKGQIRTSNESVSWEAINQYTKASSNISLPKMYVGNRWLGKEKNLRNYVPIVDDMGKMTEATYTIFQRMNNQGDMLRVATNVIKTDGTRAVGTYIPATNPDGKSNPVVSAVLKGEVFSGRAYVVNKWYLTKYQPILDSSGRVIGILYVGVPLDKIDALRKEILNIKLGQTGYVYVLGAEGRQKGHYIISAGGKRDGENIWDSQDESGKYFIREIVEESAKLEPGQSYYADYLWDGRVKRVALTYFKDWDWVIGAGAYEDEFQTAYVKVNSALSTLIISSLIGGVILIVIMTAISLIFGGRIVTPILKIKDVALEIAKGNLRSKINVKSNDEVGELANAFHDMTTSLQEKAHVAKAISEGNLNIDITVASDEDELGLAMTDMKEKIGGLASEIKGLTDSVRVGNLGKRGNTSAFQGGWADLIEGLNQLIEAFVQPLEVVSQYVTQLGSGDIPDTITDQYEGDFNKIKDGMNSCIQSIDLLVNDTKSLVDAALSGNLNFRANATNHTGDYSKIISGVNQTLDAVIEPVTEASSVLALMANGNLSSEVKGNYKGDHAIIKDSLNKSLEALNQLLNQTTIAIDQVTEGSNQVSQSSQALSQGATEQAAAVEEVSASITEIGGQTRQNAENAAMANGLADESRVAAEKGNQQMDQMLEAMEEINKSSAEVQKIIKVIDEIAFQTNLLALNAAVEAARAGVHGKGFAVVAEEVRNLAQRSAIAAKETTELIEGSASKAEKGAEIANGTAQSLKEIATGITKVTDLISEINHSSREQSVAVDQVSDALSQVDQITQSNTASAEESAATSEELSGQANHLREMISRFQLKDDGTRLISSTGSMKSEMDLSGSFSSESDVAKNVEKTKRRGAEIDPDSIISLDDDDFGEF